MHHWQIFPLEGEPRLFNPFSGWTGPGDGKAASVVCSSQSLFCFLPPHLEAGALNEEQQLLYFRFSPGLSLLRRRNLFGIKFQRRFLKSACARWKMKPSRSWEVSPCPALGKELLWQELWRMLIWSFCESSFAALWGLCVPWTAFSGSGLRLKKYIYIKYVIYKFYIYICIYLLCSAAPFAIQWQNPTRNCLESN